MDLNITWDLGQGHSNHTDRQINEYFQKIIDSYPRSPEAQLAPDALKELLRKP